jgi:hypothetical protein
MDNDYNDFKDGLRLSQRTLIIPLVIIIIIHSPPPLRLAKRRGCASVVI